MPKNYELNFYINLTSLFLSDTLKITLIKFKENYMSLIKKLSEKLKKISTKGAIGLVLASAITLAGCDFGANVDNNNNQGIGNSQGEIELPNEKPNESENEHTFSQLTIDMLNDEYYKNLIEEKKTNPNSTSNKFQPIPYGFIESEGYDITPILEDYLDVEQPRDCDTFIYTSNTNQNELYINTRLFFNMTTPNYSYYTIKYTLTDEQMADYKYLSENNYFESALFIQNLSYKNEAEVIDNQKIAVYTKSKIDNYLYSSDEIDFNKGVNQANIEYQGYSDGLLYFNIYSYDLDKTSDNCTVRQIKLKPTEGEEVVFEYGDVYFSPFDATIASQEALDEYLNNYTTVTCYNLNGTNFLVDELNNENTK